MGSAVRKARVKSIANPNPTENPKLTDPEYLAPPPIPKRLDTPPPPIDSSTPGAADVTGPDQIPDVTGVVPDPTDPSMPSAAATPVKVVPKAAGPDVWIPEIGMQPVNVITQPPGSSVTTEVGGMPQRKRMVLMRSRFLSGSGLFRTNPTGPQGLPDGVGAQGLLTPTASAGQKSTLG